MEVITRVKKPFWPVFIVVFVIVFIVAAFFIGKTLKDIVESLPGLGSHNKLKIEIKMEAPRALSIIEFGDVKGGVELLSEDYVLEVIIPPSKTWSAPFDSAVLSDGRIVMEGNQGHLVSVSLDKEVQETDFPAGMNFEASDDGTMWYYNWVDGELYHWKPGQQPVVVTELPVTYTDGSIAASPDGETVYVGWWKLDYDTNQKESSLYRYTEGGGLVKVLDGTDNSVLRAVEVTPAGEVYVATTKAIFRLTEDDGLILVLKLWPKYPTSDGLTSDRAGNLYFSATFGNGGGIYKLTPAGKLESIAGFDDRFDVPFGLSFDERNSLLIGVRKEKGELVSIDSQGTVRVLNDPSGLVTPIAVEEHPEGAVFVNGDEAGLLYISEGKAHTFRNAIVSYQPPAADFAFDDSGLIYYTYAAPGFESMVVTIDSVGDVNEVTKEVGGPAGIDIRDGKIYYADYEKGTVFLLTENGKSIPVVEDLYYPVGLDVDSRGNIWVTSGEEGMDVGSLDEVFSNRILRFSEGKTEEVLNLGEGHAFTFFDVDNAGNLYLPDNDRLLLRTPDGELTEIATGFKHLRGATIAKDGSIYLTDYEASALYRLKKR